MKNLSKSQRIYTQLITNVGEHLERFKTDLTKHDKSFIFESPEIPFIHCTRTTGTSIFPLWTVDKWPADDEPVKYLFSYATRREILKGQLESLKIRINTSDLFYFYNGTALFKITPDRAESIYKNYMESIQRQWDGKKQTIHPDRVRAAI